MKRQSLYLVGDDRINTTLYLHLYALGYRIRAKRSLDGVRKIITNVPSEPSVLLYSGEKDSELLDFLTACKKERIPCHTIILTSLMLDYRLYGTFDGLPCTLIEIPFDLDHIIREIGNNFSAKEKE